LTIAFLPFFICQYTKKSKKIKKTYAALGNMQIKGQKGKFGGEREKGETRLYGSPEVSLF
jgi:hypothetical protein